MDTTLYGHYERLLRVDVMGRELNVPEHNTLLRGLQFVAPESISYGRFCWNGSCNNCTVTVRSGSCESEDRACCLDAVDGMRVTAVSPELGRLL